MLSAGAFPAEHFRNFGPMRAFLPHYTGGLAHSTQASAGPPVDSPVCDVLGRRGHGRAAHAAPVRRAKNFSEVGRSRYFARVKPRALRWVLGLLTFMLTCTSLYAVPPKDGRYKGTLTLRVVVDGTTTQVKKIFSITGVVAGGTMQAAMTEIPQLGNYFTGSAFNITVGDGSVSMLPNNNGLSITLGDVRTTAVSLKGSADLGFAPAVNGSFAPMKRLLSLTMTRVGN
jgi:hypothetical protein